MKKRSLIIIFSLLLMTQILYSRQDRTTEGVKKYGQLEGTQVELDLFINLFAGLGSGGSVVSILGGGQFGLDLIFTLPKSSIYAISISPRISYVSMLQNTFTDIDTTEFEFPGFSILSKVEYGASLGVHITYFLSIGIGLYYNTVLDFPISISNDIFKTTNSYNAKDHFTVKIDANFNNFIGESKRFAFVFGLGFDISIFEFAESAVFFDGRVNAGIKYRFYLGGANAPRIKMQKNTKVKQADPNIDDKIWEPPIDAYE